MANTWRSAVAALLLALAWLGPAQARPWMLWGTGTLISPSAAFGTTCSPPPSGQYGTCTTHTPGLAAWSQMPPEIVAQARALGNGRTSQAAYISNVLAYVQNNIAIEWRFGLSKGARGALIDQSGTAFDQADLMVKLLRQGNVTNANYRAGAISLTDQQFGLWSGLEAFDQTTQTFSLNAQAVCYFLKDGGIPATVSDSSGHTTTNSCTVLTGALATTGTAVVIAHVWVEVGSTIYDPSYKQHQLFKPVPLPTALGCGSVSSPNCGSTTTPLVLGGAVPGTVGSGSFTNLNQGAVEGQLTIYAKNLQDYVQAHNRIGQLEEVVGGKRLAPTVALGSGAYSPNSSFGWDGSVGVPDQFRAKIVVTLDSLGATLWADEIAGRRVRIFSYGTGAGASPQLVLYADDTQVAAATCSICVPNSGPPTPVAANVGITVYSPYLSPTGYGSFGDPYPVESITSPITIIAQWGEAGPSTQQFYADLQAADPSPFKVAGSTLCTGAYAQDVCREDAQPTLAAQALAQQSQADRVLGAVAGAQITHHFRLGTVSDRAYGGSAAISVEGYVSPRSASNDGPTTIAVFDSAALLAGTIYGSVIQQAGDLTETGSGVSALVKANAQGIALVNVAPNTASTLFSNSSLTGYSSARQTTITTLNNAGAAYILPQMGQLSGTVDGGSFVNLGSQQGSAVNETLGGGASWLTASPGPSTVDLAAGVLRTAGAPSSGGFMLTPSPDIVTGDGDFPFSLAFQRTYASDYKTRDSQEDVIVYGPGTYSPVARGAYMGPDVDVSSRLGGGWTHNFEITARISNDGMKAMGRDSALDASAFIAGVYTLMDTKRTSGFTNDLAALFEANWLTSKLVRNAVTITRGAASEEFQLLPRTTYNPPAGSPDAVTVSGGSPVTVSYQNSQGLTGLVNDYSAMTGISFTDKSGSVISFVHTDWLHNYAASGNPALPVFGADTWTFPTGMKLRFSYPTAPVTNVANVYKPLSGVSNSAGRSLTFTLASDNSSSSTNYFRTMITAVMDENGRSVGYTRTNCPNLTFNNGFGTVQTPSLLNCGTLTFTEAEHGDYTRTFTYGYAAGPDSPDPSLVERPSYRLRRWYKPSNPTTAAQVIAYDELYRAKTSTDILGNQSQTYTSALFPTDQSKRVEGVDPLGKTGVSMLDQWGDVLSATDPLNRTTTYAYDSAHRLVLTTLPELNTLALTYDVRSNVLTTVTHPNPPGTLSDMTTSASYEEGPGVYPCTMPAICNLPASSTDARGHTTNYSYDSASGLPVQILRPADANGVRPETDFNSDPYAMNNGDSVRRIKDVTEKISTTVSTTTHRTFAGSAQKYVPATTVVDYVGGGLNLTTSYTYDGIGNLTAVDGPLPGAGTAADVYQYAYDQDRRMYFSIRPYVAGIGLYPANLTLFDQDGNVAQNLNGSASSIDHNTFNTLQIRYFIYDAAGRKAADKLTNAGASSTMGYTQYAYDADGRLLCTAVRMNMTVVNSLPDACTASSTANSVFGPDRITRINYDDAGQVLSTIRGYGGSNQITYQAYTYTPNGEAATLTDARSNRTTYSYDGFDRLTKLQFPDPAIINTSSTTDYEAYGYDASGNMTSKNLRNSPTPGSAPVIAFAYDSLNRMTHKGGSAVADVDYVYDLLGRRLSVTYISSGAAVTNTYDAAGRMLTETANGRTLAYQYDQAGDRTRITWPDTSYYVQYLYDGGGLVTEADEWGRTDLPHRLAVYTRNVLLQPVSTTRATDATFSATGVKTYPYFDDINRLTGLTHDLAGTAYDLTLGFAYSPGGQIVTRSEATSAYTYAPVTGSTAKTYDGLNRDAAIAGLGNGYDARGNLTNEGSGARTFTYDGENHLLTVGGSSSLTLSYDATGRLQQTVSGSTTTNFLYSGDLLVGEYDGSGNLLRRYIPSGNGGDTPLTSTASAAESNRSYYVTDNQGSIVATTDGGGNVGNIFAYGPYGEPNTWSGSRYLYTGQIALPEAQLYYYKARVYDPIAGRFLQNDPVGYGDGPNMYGYVHGDPINGSDPSGLDFVTGSRIDGAFSVGCSGCIDSGLFVNTGADASEHGAAVAYGCGGGDLDCQKANAAAAAAAAGAAALGHAMEGGGNGETLPGELVVTATRSQLSNSNNNLSLTSNGTRAGVGSIAANSDELLVTAVSPIRVAANSWTCNVCHGSAQPPTWLCAITTCFPRAGPIPRVTPAPPPRSNEGDCGREWAEAEAICRRMLSKPNSDNNGARGGYTDVLKCARGLVSEQCGGNPYNRGK